MDDDADWFAGGDDEPAPVLKPLKKPGAAEPEPEPEAEAAPAAEGEGELGEEFPEGAEDDYLDPDKLLLFKHWIRPKILPYKYITLYRHIYYDDVVDYLDKRSRGIPRDLPHAETWAERIVRNCRNKLNYEKVFKRGLQQDLNLVDTTKLSGRFFYYHNKQIFNRKFSPLLY